MNVVRRRPRPATYRRQGDTHDCLRSSGPELVEKPARTHTGDVRAHSSAAAGKCSVGGDEDYRLRGGFGEGDKGVVAVTGRVDDLDAVGDALLNASARDAFEYHHDGRAECGAGGGGANACNELLSRLGSVPPPAGWTRPDDVRSIDEQHIRKTRTIPDRAASLSNGPRPSSSGVAAAGGLG